jgi:hypothetical protein
MKKLEAICSLPAPILISERNPFLHLANGYHRRCKRGEVLCMFLSHVINVMSSAHVGP